MASPRCGRCSTAASGSGLGTDGPASNDGLDLLADARLAASLARLAGRSATALTAAEAFWLASGGAADAIGRPDLGQLAVGRRADLVHVDTRALAFEPVGDPADLLAHLVWSGGSRYVRDVWVGGRPVVRDGASTTVDTGRRYGPTSPPGPPASLPAETPNSSTERLTTHAVGALAS